MKQIAAALLTLTLLAPSAYCAPVWDGDVCRAPPVENRNTVPLAARPSVPVPEGVPVAFIGDSLAYGLAQASGAQNGGVVGIGLSGKRLRSMVALNQTTLSADYQRWLSLSHNAHTIIEIGTNDFGYTQPPERYAQLLDRYILPLHPACLVLPPPTARDDVMRGIEKLWPVMREWGAAHGIRTIDFPRFSASERAKDGIHFTHGGYVHLAHDIRQRCNL